MNMKKLGFLLSFFMLFLLGCGDDSDVESDYDPFLPDEEDSYGLYIVTESEENEIDFEVLRENNINNTSQFSGTDSLENTQLSEIEEVPSYLVFDTEGKVFETNDKEELLEFLQEN